MGISHRYSSSTSVLKETLNNQYNGETSVNLIPTVIRECLLQIYSATLNSRTVFGVKELRKVSEAFTEGAD